MLRGLAALAVVFHHTLEESNAANSRFSPDWLTTSGASGVDLFFVISGFIMIYVNFRDSRSPPGAKLFLFKRFARIYPFYWICCILVLIASAEGLFRNHIWAASDIFNSFVLLPVNRPLISVSWTLVYEIYFYLIFSIFLPLNSIKKSVIGTVFLIILMIYLAHFVSDGNIKTFLISPLPLEFCFGLVLAWGFILFQNNEMHWPVCVKSGIAGLSLLFIAPLFVPHNTTNGLPDYGRVAAWGLPAILVVAGFLRAKAPKNRLESIAVALGDASFSLYLTHSFVMPIYARLLKTTVIADYNQVPFVALTVAVSLGAGLAAHVMVERPLLQLLRSVQFIRSSSRPV